MTAAKSNEVTGKDPAAVELEKSAAKAQGANPQPEVEDAGRDENVGKVRGRDIDPTFHDEHFVDPHTGEVIENIQTVHDVPVGTNKDGSVKWAKATDAYAKVAKK